MKQGRGDGSSTPADAPTDTDRQRPPDHEGPVAPVALRPEPRDAVRHAEVRSGLHYGDLAGATAVRPIRFTDMAQVVQQRMEARHDANRKAESAALQRGASSYDVYVLRKYSS